MSVVIRFSEDDVQLFPNYVLNNRKIIRPPNPKIKSFKRSLSFNKLNIKTTFLNTKKLLFIKQNKNTQEKCIL